MTREAKVTPRRYLGFHEQRYYDQGVPYNGRILDVHRCQVPRARLIETERLTRLHFRVSAIEFRVDVYRGIGTRADTPGGNKKREYEGILSIGILLSRSLAVPSRGGAKRRCNVAWRFASPGTKVTRKLHSGCEESRRPMR